MKSPGLSGACRGAAEPLPLRVPLCLSVWVVAGTLWAGGGPGCPHGEPRRSLAAPWRGSRSWPQPLVRTRSWAVVCGVPSSPFPRARLPEPRLPQRLPGPRARPASAALTCPGTPSVAAALTSAGAKMNYYVVLIFSHYLALIKMCFAEFNMRLQMTQRIKCLIY